MRKISLLIVFILGLLLLYNYAGFFRKKLDNHLLPSTYNEYSYLHENNVASEDYQVTKIINGSSYDGFRYHTGTKEFVIEVADEDYDRNNMGWKTYWKIDKDGKIIDSLNTTNYMHESGVFLDSTTYVDWVQSGNKVAQKYSQVIDYDSISKSDFDALAQKAKTIVYGSDYENESTNCYLNISDKWLVIASKKAFDLNLYSDEKSFFKLEPKSIDSLIVLEDNIIPWQDWKNENQFIHLQEFTADSRQFKPFLDFNNHGRSGWNGTGYFRLNYDKKNIFYFKSFTFKGTNFDPDIAVYNFQKTKDDVVKTPDVGFIVLRRNKSSKADIKRKGVYVVSKRE